METKSFTIMHMDKPLIKVEWCGAKVTSTPLTEQVHPKIPYVFWYNETKWSDVAKFFESRTVPRTREDIDDILKRYELPEYMPMQMCQKSHGVSMTDHIWIKFDYEEYLTYADVRVRNW